MWPSDSEPSHCCHYPKPASPGRQGLGVGGAQRRPLLGAAGSQALPHGLGLWVLVRTRSPRPGQGRAARAQHGHRTHLQTEPEIIVTASVPLCPLGPCPSQAWPQTAPTVLVPRQAPVSSVLGHRPCSQCSLYCPVVGSEPKSCVPPARSSIGAGDTPTGTSGHAPALGGDPLSASGGSTGETIPESWKSFRGENGAGMRVMGVLKVRGQGRPRQEGRFS